MTSTTEGFINAAAASDMYEVTAGKIAVQRAQSLAVKMHLSMAEKLDARAKSASN